MLEKQQKMIDSLMAVINSVNVDAQTKKEAQKKLNAVIKTI